MHASHKAEKSSPFCRLPQTDGYLGPPFASLRRRTFGPSADRSWGLTFWCVVLTFRFDPVADKSVTKHAQDEYVRESNKKSPTGKERGKKLSNISTQKDERIIRGETYLNVRIACCTVAARHKPIGAQDGHDQLQWAGLEAELDLYPAADTVLLRDRPGRCQPVAVPRAGVVTHTVQIGRSWRGNQHTGLIAAIVIFYSSLKGGTLGLINEAKWQRMAPLTRQNG